MYSRCIVEQRLVMAASELGWKPEYHTPSEVDTFIEQLDHKYEQAHAQAASASHGSKEAPQVYQSFLYRELCDPERPKLTAEEIRFMQNERALVICDADYFLSRYFAIKNRENNMQRFSFQMAQRVLFDVISEMEDIGCAIELMIPKARQLGVSTLSVGLGLHKVAFSFGVSGIVASAESDKTEDMVSKIFLAYEMMPWWLRPTYTKRVNSAKGSFVFGASRADFRFQHGNQMAGIARGSTPVFYMLSEVSSYDNPEQLIEAALWKCVHPSPRVLGIKESTCAGNTGWWNDTYWYSKANWPRSRMKTAFLPFYLAADMYPNESWLRKNPIPERWRRDTETKRMVAESMEYIATDAMLKKILGKDYKIPEATQWYWQCEFLEARAKGQGKLFLQEMPHTDKAAFQGSYDNVFGRETIEACWVQRDTKYAVYGITGQSIEERHEPESEDIDPDLGSIPVSYESRRGQIYRWSLMPLKWREDFKSVDELRNKDAHMGKLFVFLPPERGYDYAIGVKTSNGIGIEATCIAVSRRGRHPQEPDVQAAEFRSDLVSHVEAYSFALAIAAFYARHMEETTRYREPYVAIEQMTSVGDTCQLQMSKMGYHRFHKMTRYDSMPKDLKKSKARKRGWYSSAWSTPMLTDDFVVYVQNGIYILHSPWTIYECDHWEVHYTGESGKSKLVHAEDCTDDGIRANAMAAFCPNDLSIMADRSRTQSPGQKITIPLLDLSPITEGITMRVGE